MISVTLPKPILIFFKSQIYLQYAPLGILYIYFRVHVLFCVPGEVEVFVPSSNPHSKMYKQG